MGWGREESGRQTALTEQILSCSQFCLEASDQPISIHQHMFKVRIKQRLEGQG